MRSTFIRQFSWALIPAALLTLLGPIRADAPAAAAPPSPKPYGGPISAWNDIEAKVAAQPPTVDSPEKKYLKMRISAKAYYEQYKGWTAPLPPPLQDGQLRNLSEIPTQLRFPLAGKDWPQKPGDASVCLWEDDKIAAISFLLWGSLPGSLAAAEELGRTKYPAARFSGSLIVGYLEHPSLHPGVSNDGLSPTAWDPYKSAFSQGFEFMSQSMCWDVDPVYEDGWPGPEWECAESIHQIDTNIPGHRTRVFLYPGGYMPPFNVGKSWRPVVTQYFCAAMGRLSEGINTANQVDYFNIAGFDSKVDPTVDSDPNPTDKSFSNVLNADPANPFYKYYRGWIIPNCHVFTTNTATDPSSIPMGKALDFFQRHEGDLWSGTISSVARYGEERDTASAETAEASESKITLKVSCKLDAANFDYPLTIKVRLPASWKNIGATQDGKAVPSQVIQHEGSSFALIKVVPNKGLATLLPK